MEEGMRDLTMIGLNYMFRVRELLWLLVRWPVVERAYRLWQYEITQVTG